MGIQFHTAHAIVKTIRGNGPARRASKKTPPQKSRWPRALLMSLPVKSNLLSDVTALRKRLTYISSLESRLKKANTPFEERLFFNGVKMAFQALRHNGLITASATKSSQLATSRRHIARLLIGVMKKTLKARISELVALENIKLMDLPSAKKTFGKSRRTTPARKAPTVSYYMRMIRDLPKK